MLHEIPADVLHMLLRMLQKLPPLSAGADMRAWHRGCAAHRHGHEPHARRGGKEIVSESRKRGASDGASMCLHARLQSRVQIPH